MSVRRPLRFFAWPLFAALLVSPGALGVSIHNDDADRKDNVRAHAHDKDFVVKLLSNHAKHRSAGLTAAELALLQNEFPNWAFTSAQGPLAGNIRVLEYDAVVDGPGGVGNCVPAGNCMVAKYQSGPVPATAGTVFGNVSAGKSTIRWIQFVTMNQPWNANCGNHFLDPCPNDDTLPFYWTEAENVAQAKGNFSAGTSGGTTWVNLTFKDAPRLKFARGSPVTMEFDTLLVETNITMKTMKVFDGVKWGFEWGCTRERPGGTHTFGGVYGVAKNVDDPYDGPVAPAEYCPTGAAGVPTLSEWGGMVLAAVLVVGGVVLVRRR